MKSSLTCSIENDDLVESCATVRLPSAVRGVEDYPSFLHVTRAQYKTAKSGATANALFERAALISMLA